MWPGTIRIAEDEDGPKIGQLYKECEWADHDVDWTRPGIGRWWIVAEENDEIVGAMQVVASQPFSYIGDIIIRPSYRARDEKGKGRLSRKVGLLPYSLYIVGLALLEKMGTEICFGIVAENQQPLKKFLMNHGGTDLGNYSLMGRRL